MDASTFDTSGIGINLPSAQDLENVNFTPTFYPAPAPGQQNMYNQ